ncbi:sulfotransferase domain-containing protein [Rubripirellula sp.]|nr:sulfotransferase domain-containing protein [Rubripirellula sp.]MDB4645234.1 sulfotransferase domain-containing protein [Rubripirellula sp.]
MPNVRLVHYSELKREIPSEIRVIAEFLDIPINESKCETIVEYYSFDWMETECYPKCAFRRRVLRTRSSTVESMQVGETLTTQESMEYEELADAKLGT